MRHFINKIAIVLLFAGLSVTVNATISLPVIFQSNMVLQRDKEVAIWGFGNPGEKVVIDFNDKVYVAITGKSRNWSITLPSQGAGGPYDITLKGASNSIELKNILFGDIWICGGQSNMEYTIYEMGYSPEDTAAVSSEIRIFTASINMDYVPQNDLSGGNWKVASGGSIKNFSAIAYFFGKFLHDSLNIPIGLISDNLGSTAIEPWMSPEALSGFSQFDSFYKEYLAPGKSFKEITAVFEKMKPEWESGYYLRGQGIEQEWYLPRTDISDWKTMEIPSWWEDKGLTDYDGAVWFRKSFDLPADFKEDSLVLALDQVDDYDIMWINGQKVGEGYGNLNWRNYKVPATFLKSKGNVIVVRVFDTGGKGGIYSQDINDDPILSGKWFYKPDYKVDAKKIPRPHIVNVSPYSTPAILYNGNIAPLTSLSIKGFIWYQGESNGGRAKEYYDLFPALIRDWRNHFKQGDLPFLFVQLPNFLEEDTTPGESDWAELRDAQASALKLPNTGMAVTIDIGDAKRIHPKNKLDVGKRLAIVALQVAYKKDIVGKGPTYEYMEINSDTVIIHYAKEKDSLLTKDKYGYVRGFAVAGDDNKFYWAKAYIKNNTVILTCKEVSHPGAVRYAWSFNPGIVDLYNSSGLPAVPFRTDNLPLKTAGKVFTYSQE
jgi:sialate O-acetylesterase